MNIDKISCHLIKNLRGNLSQEQLARKINLSKTQIYRWEKGINQIRWDKYSMLAREREIPINQAIELLIGKNNQVDQISSVIFLLTEGKKTKEVEEKTGISRQTLLRWITDESLPSLNQFLLMIYKFRPYLFLDFIKILGGDEIASAASSQYETIKREKGLTYEKPIIAAILRCLELKEYKDKQCHESGYIAQKLGISKQEELDALDTLEFHSLIELSNNKYVLSQRSVDMRGHPSKIKEVNKFWIQKSLEKIENKEKSDIYGFNVFSLSHQEYEKVFKLYLKFYEDIREIVDSETKTPEDVFVLCFQLFKPGYPKVSS